MNAMEIVCTPRIRIRAEEPEHWSDYLERILGDFPEVREVRFIAAESVLENPRKLEHYQARSWKRPTPRNENEAPEIIHMASIMAIYLGGPSTTHRMRRLRLTLRRIFPERQGKPVRFTIVSASARGRARHGLMGRIMAKGACLYKV